MRLTKCLPISRVENVRKNSSTELKPFLNQS